MSKIEASALLHQLEKIGVDKRRLIFQPSECDCTDTGQTYRVGIKLDVYTTVWIMAIEFDS